MGKSSEKFIEFPVRHLNPEAASNILHALLGESQDSLDLFTQGLRYSPKAIRILTVMSHAVITLSEQGEKYMVPNIQQFSENLDSYAYTIGFISKLERRLMRSGVPLIFHLANNKEELYIKDTPDKVSHILRSVEQLSAYLHWTPKLKNMKSVLFHGKWNVPHVYHFAYINESLKKISEQFSIPREVLLPIIVCERNKYIHSTGSSPFMDTAWRGTLLSYAPFGGIVIPGGDIEISEAESYWNYAYDLIKPNFLPIEAGDLFTDSKTESATRCGITIVDIPTVKQKNTDMRISSTGLLTEGLLPDESFYKQVEFFEKNIGTSWRRSWF